MKKIRGINQFNQYIEIHISNGKIINVFEIGSNNKIKNYIFPGFISVDECGGFNFDWTTQHSKKQSIKYLKKVARIEGTTSMVGTLISSDYAKMKKAFDANSKLINKHGKRANFLGFHLRGPFVNILQDHSNPKKCLMPLTIDNLGKIIGKENFSLLKILTFAPELTTEEDVKKVSNLGIRLQIGHSLAEFDDYFKVQEYIHGMSNFNDELLKTSTNTAKALINDAIRNDLYLEFINDCSYDNSNLATQLYRNKQRDRIILVTNSLKPKGLKDGWYADANSKLEKRACSVWNESGFLCGTVHSMSEAFRRWVVDTGSTLNDAVLATSTNAADYLKLKKGRLEKDYDADLVIMDKNFRVLKTYVNGKKV